MKNKRFKIILIDEENGTVDLFETNEFNLETDIAIVNETFYVSDDV